MFFTLVSVTVIIVIIGSHSLVTGIQLVGNNNKKKRKKNVIIIIKVKKNKPKSNATKHENKI